MKKTLKLVRGGERCEGTAPASIIPACKLNGKLSIIVEFFRLKR